MQRKRTDYMNGREYERRNRRRRRKRQRIKEIFFLMAVLVVLIAGGGLLLHSLLNQPLTVLSGLEDKEEDWQPDGTRTDADAVQAAEDEEDRRQPDGTRTDVDAVQTAEDEEDRRQPDGMSTAGQPDQESPNGSASDLAVDLTHLYSRYAVLVDNESGNILAQHDAQERIYPASMTKIMTAVLAVENTSDMEETVTVPEDIFPQLYAEDASMAGFLPGEKARLRDLLYGILLPSGAECCLTFADRIAGSETAFVELMNRKAEELGLANTHFCNATGLHDPDHYSTAEDIASLLRYALQSRTFREAFTGNRYSVAPSEQHPDGFTFVSTMFSYMGSADVTGGRILGGKTGYTEEAGQCLASLAEIGGEEYILVTAKADGTHETEQFHILDAQNVYNQIGASTGADAAGEGAAGTDAADANVSSADEGSDIAGADIAGASDENVPSAGVRFDIAGADTAGASDEEDRAEYWWETRGN